MSCFACLFRRKRKKFLLVSEKQTQTENDDDDFQNNETKTQNQSCQTDNYYSDQLSTISTETMIVYVSVSLCFFSTKLFSWIGDCCGRMMKIMKNVRIFSLFLLLLNNNHHHQNHCQNLLKKQKKFGD